MAATLFGRRSLWLLGALALVGAAAIWLLVQPAQPAPRVAPAPEAPPVQPASGTAPVQPAADLAGEVVPGSGVVEVELRFLGGTDEERVLEGPGGSLEGRVIDQAGAGIAGVRITVLGGPQDGWIAISDAQGRYLFPAVLPGTQFFRLEAPGRPPAARIQRVGERGRTQRDFDLGEPVSLQLLVRGPDGKPLKGARVRVDLDVRERETGEDGLAAFAGVPGGARVLVDVLAPGCVPTRHELNLLPAAQSGSGPVELPPLESGGVIQGVVKSWPGGPLPRVTILPRADRPDGAQVIWETWQDIETGPDGRFRLENVPTTRTVDVRVAHPEGVPDPPLRSVRAAPGAGAFVDFVLVRGDARVAGVVLGPENQPLPGALVALEAADPLKVLAAEYPGLAEGPISARIPVPPSLRRELLTGADGRFDFAWGDHKEGTGALLLVASKAGYAPARAEIRSSRDHVTLRLKPEQRDGALRLTTRNGAPADLEARWFLDGQPLAAPRELLRGVYEVQVRRGERLLFQSGGLIVGPDTPLRLGGA